MSATELSADLMSLARSVAAGIQKDKAAPHFIGAGDELQASMALAYADAWGRTLGQIQGLYLTNPEFKKMFAALICKLSTGD